MRIKKMTLFAILCALSVVLGLFESMLPVFHIVPGGKIGLANSITMVVFCLFAPLETICFGLLRCLLSSVLYSGFSAFWYSAAGTVLSIAAMWLFSKILNGKISEIGISVIGAFFFNVGQLFVCACVLESVAVFRYLPALGMVSAIAGMITGMLAKAVIKYLKHEKLTKNGNGAIDLWK